VQDELQSWLGAFDQAILAAIYDLREGRVPSDPARGIVSDAVTRASITTPHVAEPRTKSDPTPPKAPAMAPVLERSASAVQPRKFERLDGFKYPGSRSEPSNLQTDSFGVSNNKAVGSEPAPLQSSVPGPVKSPFLTADAKQKALPPFPSSARKAPTGQNPPFTPTNTDASAKLVPAAKQVLVSSIPSPIHTDASSKYVPAAKHAGGSPELADLPPEVAAAITSAAQVQAKMTASGLVHDLAAAEARATHAEAMYKAMATAEGERRRPCFSLDRSFRRSLPRSSNLNRKRPCYNQCYGLEKEMRGRA
jgi:hypothetical protein